jgi:hypothetical protein
MPRVHCACPESARAGGPARPGAAIELGSPPQRAWACPACSGEHALHLEHLAASGGLLGCLACGHPELYTQRDFPHRLGLAIVAGAAIAAPFTHYASLLAAAALDALLYWLGPQVVVCYVCGSAHRDFPREPRHPAFDREIDERLKFGARAVMGKPMRPGGSAGAPEPEH